MTHERETPAMDYRRFRFAAIACANGILGTITTIAADAGPLLTAVPLTVAVIGADQMRRNRRPAEGK